MSITVISPTSLVGPHSDFRKDEEKAIKDLVIRLEQQMTTMEGIVDSSMTILNKIYEFYMAMEKHTYFSEGDRKSVV